MTEAGGETATAAPAQGGVVPMIGQDGVVRDVPAAQVAQFSKIARVATPQDLAAHRQRAQTPQGQPGAAPASPYSALVAPGVAQRSYGGMAPGRVPNEILSQDLATRRAEAIAQATTQRQLAVQGLKGEQGNEKNRVPVDENTNKVYALAGLDKPEGESVSKTEFETVSKLAQMKSKPNNGSDLTQEEQNALVGATMRKDNPLAPSIISFKGPRSKTMAQALIKDPNWSPNKAEGELAGSRAGAAAAARFDESGPGQVVARVANSAMEQLDDLQKASDSFPRSDVKMFNTPIMKIDEQTMPEAQNWKIALNTARMEYAAALNRGNSPGLENIAEAAKALPDTITMKQLPGAIAQLRKGLTNTVKGMTTRVPPGGASKEKTAPVAKGASESDPLGLGI